MVGLLASYNVMRHQKSDFRSWREAIYNERQLPTLSCHSPSELAAAFTPVLRFLSQFPLVQYGTCTGQIQSLQRSDGIVEFPQAVIDQSVVVVLRR